MKMLLNPASCRFVSSLLSARRADCYCRRPYPRDCGIKINHKFQVPRISIILKQVGRARSDPLQCRIPAHEKSPDHGIERIAARVQKQPTARYVVTYGWGADAKLRRAASRSAVIN